MGHLFVDGNSVRASHEAAFTPVPVMEKRTRDIFSFLLLFGSQWPGWCEGPVTRNLPGI